MSANELALIAVAIEILLLVGVIVVFHRLILPECWNNKRGC